MDNLYKELQIDEIEQFKGKGFGALQCTAIATQCSSGGAIGCGGGSTQACDTYERYCT
ncbi:sublancin family glycopeptide [Salibacterium salarium]|uniref:Sublancin family glycopeptide n=1 Tax=Salibacterium salarium TaxID=284579 RepID=A0A3R9QMC4_9BACI|nr:sublancin family glycopeptide [Salibacterium salarium]RSL29004.1 sublancin family glycopeptide [Salibacterium salarium]